MGVLYHYSSLVHLPPIIRDGLSEGEVSVPNPRGRTTAVSLTSQTDYERLFLWGKPERDPHKTAVRYACHLEDGDDKQEPARSAWRQLNVPPKYLKQRLDPLGQAKWWYFYHGVIPPGQFTVEFWGRRGYVPVPPGALSRIAAEVELARGFFEFFVQPGKPLDLFMKLKNPADTAPLWLMEEAFPADRFLSDSSTQTD